MRGFDARVQGKEDENEALGDALPHRERKRGRYQTRTDDDTHADARWRHCVLTLSLRFMAYGDVD